MRVNLRTEGLDSVISSMAAMPGRVSRSRRAALADLGKKVVEDLKAGRKSGFGWPPPGPVSLATGKRSSWGKKAFTSRLTRDGSAVIVTTRGMNRNIEEGGPVTISDRFKSFLRSRGVFLRKDRTLYNVPPRPLFGPVFSRGKSGYVAYMRERFFYRLQRSLRGMRYV